MASINMLVSCRVLMRVTSLWPVVKLKKRKRGREGGSGGEMDG